ncbi:RING-type E3 ubiquitin-protein ligase PPIL2-like isoform X2 [Paramacrobiotus metropolitanus]|uniref:RING-type E3 ubiquitin-protein ligase PPIL2-like isoform X2 n=1 Tax=Paramacrobiotus metropolitanus TaxID=2943436 RepID=UPI002446543B|nr:RING-type E3 ubiquitin-protein ligase PPIL2-like isoform X2 [Paramacrobiotus metropolitanus]
MGKRQHQKDKLYLTTTEWSGIYGGKAAALAARPGSSFVGRFRRLPFYACAISLQPFENPYVSPDGFVFDLVNILPYLKKYGTHPCTGKYYCPATYKPFNENTHIVCIKPTGNVFSYEAVENLNIKAKNFRDLITDAAFQKSDIISLQDPSNLERLNMESFHHIKNSLKAKPLEAGQGSGANLKSISVEAKAALAELEKDYKKPQDLSLFSDSKTPFRPAATDSVNAAHYSTGLVAAGFTSTVMEPVTVQTAAMLDEDAIRYDRVKKRQKKAYVRLITNFGALNLEIHADMATKTSDNFLRHCRAGYYTETIFHRLIKNFMIQGGDPTGTGKGGASAFEGGKEFEDELKTGLKHDVRGIVSMANSGPNTNKSQFFIIFRPQKHLDGKHSVFGRVVGGLDVLAKLEQIPVDDTDKPTHPIKIINIEVFQDPFADVEKEIAEERKRKADAVAAETSFLKENPGRKLRLLTKALCPGQAGKLGSIWLMQEKGYLRMMTLHLPVRKRLIKNRNFPQKVSSLKILAHGDVL